MAKRTGIKERQRAEAQSLVRSLASTVERYEGVPAKVLLGPCRERPVAEARWAVMLAARRQGCSLLHIAAGLENDHTSVFHGLKRAERLEQDDPGFAALVGCLSVWAEQDVAA